MFDLPPPDQPGYDRRNFNHRYEYTANYLEGEFNSLMGKEVIFEQRFITYSLYVPGKLVKRNGKFIVGRKLSELDLSDHILNTKKQPKNTFNLEPEEANYSVLHIKK